MLDAFIMVLREGFESFLIVAIILSYLKVSGRQWLMPAVYMAIILSIILSLALGYVLMQGVNQPLWEATMGVVAIIMVTTLVIHMWRTGSQLKRQMEQRLNQMSSKTSRLAGFAGIFLFTTLMITREGMETAMMLMLVRDTQWVAGAFLGLGAAAATAWLWVHFSHLINLKRFFQVTGVFLLLFMLQIAVYTFHEFSEVGILPNSDSLHAATEVFSPMGIYGRWFSLLTVSVCLFWLAGAWAVDRFKEANAS